MVKPRMMIRTTAKANGNSVLSRKSFRVHGFVPRTETEAPEAPRTQTKIQVELSAKEIPVARVVGAAGS